MGEQHQSLESYYVPFAYSVAEVARATTVSKQTIYAEIEAGRLRAVRVRSRLVIPRAALDEWLSAR